MKTKRQRPTYHQLMAQKITPEEKERWAPMLRATWHAIGDDVEHAFEQDMGQKLTRAIIIECTLDANRPEMYGGMTPEEYSALCAMSHSRGVKRWLNKVLCY